MILSDKHIFELLKNNRLIITPNPLNEDINCNRIDLHLSDKLLRYKVDTLDLRENSTDPIVEEITIAEEGYVLKPGDFFLGSTVEKVEIPNGYFGFVETKGNIARAGIQAHNADGHIDPGFVGNITLEIKNNSNHSIIIYPNIKFVQIRFLKSTSESINPYQGKYQNQEGATVYKKG
jgi:dCTP deaminase